jgi:hypothetical protein
MKLNTLSEHSGPGLTHQAQALNNFLGFCKPAVVAENKFLIVRIPLLNAAD